MRIGVLALQGAVAEHLRALESSGAEAVTVRRPAELGGLDGLIVPGGESTTMARLAAPVGLLPQIRAAHDEGMALFGTCAGMILMAEQVADAEALQGFDRIGGLGILVRRNGYGSQLDSFTADLEVAAWDSPLPAVFIRAPIVESVGPEVEVLASAAERPVAVRQGRMMASSFHPELTADTRLHEIFVQLAGS